jgi:hypothetical protein
MPWNVSVTGATRVTGGGAIDGGAGDLPPEQAALAMMIRSHARVIVCFTV